MTMHTRKRLVVASVTAALMLAGTAACSSTNDANTNTGTTAITIRGCTPQRPLLPADTHEVCGGNVLDASEAKLIHYNADTAAPELDVAESITTEDAITFTVKLNKGYKFQDGTELKAKNFVDAWNWGAYGPNMQSSSSFFEMIEGFDEVQCGDADCNQKPTAETMTGLKVVDDYTFTITCDGPTSNLETRLGYTAFAPQPDAFFADTSAKKADFAKKPIAAGPYQVTSVTDTEIVLEKFADYSGKFPGSVDKITFRVYTDTTTAYNDVVANHLDLTDVIPSDSLVGDLWKKDLVNTDGTTRWGAADTGVIQILSFAPARVDPGLADVRIRQALSMALDRDAVTKAVFNGNRTPATGWVAPAADGYKPGACGDACTYNPTKAKELYDAAGGYPGTLHLWVNGDGGHGPWATAVCNSLKEALGVDCQVSTTPDFATLRDKITKRELDGMYRGGWQMDYPSIENFLAPIYSTGASSNDTDYDNPAFNQLLKDAAAADNNDSANALYQQAEAMLGRDFPTMPLWYQQSQYGYSSKIKSVKMNPFSTFDYGSIVLA